MFGELAREYPLSYYGWRARRFSGSESGEAKPVEVADGRRGLRPSELARARILMEASLEQQGREEMARLSTRARGLDDRLSLAQLLTDAEDYNRAQRLMVDAYQEQLAHGPASGLEEMWWYAWPSAYSNMVEEATRSPDSVPSELVYSIMREESGYRPGVVSAVGARGLLQIMGETGSRLASTRGMSEFEIDDLFVPQVNIDLGSFYLGELRRRFAGQLSASIASYNAGPNAVAKWVQDSKRPDDEWVEEIPYDQTRGYVKRVLRSMYAYRVLY